MILGTVRELYLHFFIDKKVKIKIIKPILSSLIFVKIYWINHWGKQNRTLMLFPIKEKIKLQKEIFGK